jgi:hypothetical protein
MVPVLVKRRTDYYELGEFSSRSPISRKAIQEKEPGVIFIVVKKMLSCIHYAKLQHF